MKYREFLNSLSNVDFAKIVAEDGIFNIACVENSVGEHCECRYNNKDCFKCVLSLLNSDADNLDLLKRSDIQD